MPSVISYSQLEVEKKRYEDGMPQWHYIHDLLSCYAVTPQGLPASITESDVTFAAEAATDHMLMPYTGDTAKRCAGGPCAPWSRERIAGSTDQCPRFSVLCALF